MQTREAESEIIQSERCAPARCRICGWPGELEQERCSFCRSQVEITLALARKQIFTAGYWNLDFEKFNARRRELGAAVFDIRLAPQSSKQEWRYNEMRRALGSGYKHVPDLGNTRYKQGFPIEIANLNRGIDEVLKETRPVILLCGCKWQVLCHRYVVTCALRERGCEPVEITEWEQASEV